MFTGGGGGEERAAAATAVCTEPDCQGRMDECCEAAVRHKQLREHLAVHPPLHFLKYIHKRKIESASPRVINTEILPALSLTMRSKDTSFSLAIHRRLTVAATTRKPHNSCKHCNTHTLVRTTKGLVVRVTQWHLNVNIYCRCHCRHWC